MVLAACKMGLQIRVFCRIYYRLSEIMAFCRFLTSVNTGLRVLWGVNLVSDEVHYIHSNLTFFRFNGTGP